MLPAFLMTGPGLELASLGHRMLVDAGYVAIGFDHFARAGDPMAEAARQGRVRRNFQGFTDDGARCVVGLGASAISVFPELIVQNREGSRPLSRPVCQSATGWRARLIRNEADRARQTLSKSLLCRMSVPLDPETLNQGVAARLRRFEAMGLVRHRRGRLEICEEGRPYARHVAALFDRYSGNRAGAGLR